MATNSACIVSACGLPNRVATAGSRATFVIYPAVLLSSGDYALWPVGKDPRGKICTSAFAQRPYF